MTAVKTINGNSSFINEYLELYKNGKTGLGRLIGREKYDTLNEICKIKTNDEFKNDNARYEYEYTLLYKSKQICEIASNAEEMYYKTNWGKVKKFTQGLAKKIFGIETSLDRAKSWLLKVTNALEINRTKQCVGEISQLNESASSSSEREASNNENLQKRLEGIAVCEAEVAMARDFARKGKKEITFTQQGFEPNGTLRNYNVHVNPHGDLYTDIDKTDKSFLLETLAGRVYKIFTQRVLGRGAEAIVFSGREIVGSSKDHLLGSDVEEPNVAIRVSIGNPKTISDTQHAVDICRKFHHPGIIEIKSNFNPAIASFTPPPMKHADLPPFAFNHEKAAYTITDLYEKGTLGKFLKNVKDKSKEQKVHLILSLINIFAELQKKGVVHRDVKPENFLLKENEKENDLLDPILTDFGCAVLLGDEVSKMKEESDFAQGAQTYFAPEYLIAASKRDTTCEELRRCVAPIADIWSLGLICFQIWTGKRPEDKIFGQQPMLYESNIFNETYENGPESVQKKFLDQFSSFEIDTENGIGMLIYRMLQVDPKNRFSALKLQITAKDLIEKGKL